VDEEGAGEGNREVIRKAKNVNRSLDKLKRQIKEAKAEKKRQRELAAAGITEAAHAADSDDDLLSNQAKRAKKRKLTKEERALKHGVGSKSVARVDDEDDDEDFLVPKAAGPGDVPVPVPVSAAPSSSSSKSKSSASSSATASLFTHTASQNTKLNIGNLAPVAMKARKEKPLKITSDGLSKATIHAGTFGKKKTFAEDGEEEGPSGVWEKEEVGEAPEKLAAATAKFQSLKRKQLSYTVEEDVERDRQRIQSAHRDKRLTERDARQKETTKGVRAGAVLGNASDSD
jgi:hypothetical protein